MSEILRLQVLRGSEEQENGEDAPLSIPSLMNCGLTTLGAS